MVVRQRKSGVPPIVLYSAAGGFIAMVTLIFSIRSVVISEPISVCSARYHRASVLPYRSNGRLLAPADIQARLGERDWGLQSNGRIVAASDTPAAAALEVALPAGGKAGGTIANPVSGLGFRWTPNFLRTATHVCLTYQVWLPNEFDFGRGGVLPGVFGGDPKGKPDNQGRHPHFAVRPKWLPAGRGGLQAVTAWEPRGIARDYLGFDFRMPRGSWVAVEQEVTLNAPGSANGVLRIWINGELRFNAQDIAYRHRADVGFTGIVADTHYAAPNTIEWHPAPKDARIRLTPFVVRWH
ncbi:MAG: hypothetical protein KDJ36_10825 [Hyphomicrobiaceae bacterium]|nr:hypothetical protein [Hyphomicrobiaceae bacterium]